MTADPYLWLEDVTGDDALDWVRTRNDATTNSIASSTDFDSLQSSIRAILDTDARIPYARRRGEYLYNYWKDAEHPRGLWRRTTMDEYRKDSPTWDVLIDLDAVAAEDGENWVWSSAQVLRPAQEKALVTLSRGGADARVVREFDMVSRTFVSDGFQLPEAKTDIEWIDDDNLYVGTDFGEGTLTDSGYPRLAKKWTRGTSIEDAVTVFEGDASDVSVSAWYDRTPGFERSFVQRATDFFNAESYLLQGDSLTLIDTPRDASTSVHHEWLLVRTVSAWDTGDRTYAAGALLAIDFTAFLGGDRSFTVLFEPDAHNALHQYSLFVDGEPSAAGHAFRCSDEAVRAHPASGRLGNRAPGRRSGTSVHRDHRHGFGGER